MERGCQRERRKSMELHGPQKAKIGQEIWDAVRLPRTGNCAMLNG